MSKTFIISFLMILSVLKIQAQQGVTSGGESIIGSNYHTSFTIGEVINSNEVSEEYELKNGIIQYDQGVGTFITRVGMLDVELFPIPASEFLIISVDSADSYIYSIYDANSKLIRKANLVSDRIFLNGISAGSYILRLESSNNFYSQLFVKI